jgi:hypothetical protein
MHCKLHPDALYLCPILFFPIPNPYATSFPPPLFLSLFLFSFSRPLPICVITPCPNSYSLSWLLSPPRPLFLLLFLFFLLSPNSSLSLSLYHNSILPPRPISISIYLSLYLCHNSILPPFPNSYSLSCLLSPLPPFLAIPLVIFSP